MKLTYTLLITTIGIIAMVGLKLLTLGITVPGYILFVVIIILLAIGLDIHNYKKAVEDGHLQTKSTDYGS